MPFNATVQQRISAWNQASLAFKALRRHDAAGWEAARAGYVRALAQHPTPEGLWIDEIDMGGVSATVLVPEVVEGGRVLLYLHGGSYVAGSPAGCHGVAGRYAQLLNARVYVPEYRLAPQHPWPAAIEDALAAYRWLLNQGRPPQSIVFSGDSSGAAMLVLVMVAARRAGLPLPAAGAALSPWARRRRGSAAVPPRGIDPLVELSGLALPAGTAPLFADARGLPPLLVHAGEREPMLGDALWLAAHLARCGVRVTLSVWPDMFHGWHLFAAELPEGLQALRQAAAFLLGALPTKAAA